MARKPRIYKGPAAQYAGPDEAIYEVSIGDKGGLSPLRTTGQGVPVIDLYRFDPEVEIRVPGPATETVRCRSATPTSSPGIVMVRPNDSAPQNGLLSTHDVRAKGVLGCDGCSATVQIIDQDQIEQMLNGAT